METLLVDSQCAEKLLPAVGQALAEKGVEMRSCPQAKAILGDLAVNATNEDWDTEYLDLICSVRVVDGADGALDHINEHGSGHTECIVTEDEATARRFQLEADSSTVFWNASTRFSDGGEFGMGADGQRDRIVGSPRENVLASPYCRPGGKFLAFEKILVLFPL